MGVILRRFEFRHVSPLADGYCKGGSKSSSSSTFAPNTVAEGALGISNSSNVTVNTQVVDQGMVALTHDVMEGVGAYAAEVARLQKDVNVELIGKADSMLANALGANVNVTNAALDHSLDAIKQSLAASSAAAADAVASANASANRTAEVSRDAMTNIGMIADRSQGYAWESAAEALGLTSNVISAAFASSSDINAMSLATVRNVADAYQTARETEVTAQFQDYRYILIAGLIVVGIIGFKAVK